MLSLTWLRQLSLDLAVPHLSCLVLGLVSQMKTPKHLGSVHAQPYGRTRKCLPYGMASFQMRPAYLFSVTLPSSERFILALCKTQMQHRVQH